LDLDFYLSIGRNFIFGLIKIQNKKA
jgi:hypothetical protein